MKLKVKILSMQRVKNHGSFLQSYALMKTLELLGAEVSFLDIQKGLDNSHFAKSNKKEYKNNKKIDWFVNRVLMKFAAKKQATLFAQQSEQHLRLLPTEMTVGNDCDLVVIGSDEVMNCAVTAKWGLSLQLFGNIPEAKRVVTYAASCGATTYDDIPQKERTLIQNSLHCLSKISVRDKNTRLFIEKMLGKDSCCENLDPVLIYDFTPKIIPCSFGKPFMLVYSYPNRMTAPEEIQMIRQYAKKHHLEVVCAGVFQKWCKYNLPMTSFELLGYFKAAECVVTDTFHGSIMSIITHRKFATVIRNSNRNKLVDLLERLGLKGRICEDIHDLEKLMDVEIDYDAVDSIRNVEREKTKKYLKTTLTEASKQE